MNTATIVQKLWNYCNVLRDDGMSYGDYVEQLTYLLFLKMADERSRPPYNQQSPVPAGYDWASLTKKDGDELFDHYRHTLEELGKQKGLLGLIFTKSQNKFHDSIRGGSTATRCAPGLLITRENGKCRKTSIYQPDAITSQQTPDIRRGRFENSNRISRGGCFSSVGSGSFLSVAMSVFVVACVVLCN